MNPIIDDPQTENGVKVVVSIASKFKKVRKVFLFGSRAQGNHSPKSDFDLAFDLFPVDGRAWGDLTSDIREAFPFLNQLDLVRLDQVSQDFREKIMLEGVLVYEQT